MLSLIFIELVVVLRLLYVILYLNPPVLQINQQGITVSYYPWTTVFTGKTSFVPWSEIAKISCFQFVELLLAIQLKDAQHWYSSYINGRSRKLRPHRSTGAHINISQSNIATPTPLRDLLQQIQENYAHEILANEIKIVPFASRFTNRSV